MGFRIMPQKWARSVLAMLTTTSLLLPPMQHSLYGQDPQLVSSPSSSTTELGGRLSKGMSSKQNLPLALDVALGAARELRGEVRDAQGKTQANTDVVLWQQNEMLQRTRTDARGRFVFTALRGGQYRIATPDVTIACRAWTAKLAPPKARESLLIVANMYSARGQQPINEVFCFNPFLMGTIVAAAIAIPIAVHDSGDGQLPDGS